MSTSLAQAAGLVERPWPRRRIDRVGAGLVAEDGHVDLAAEGAQLLDGGRALEVGADEQRVAALALEPAGELGGVGRLARALEAGHEHDRRRPGGVGDLEALAAEEGGQLLVDDLDDLLARAQRLRQLQTDGLLLDAGDDLARRRGR